MTGEPTTEELEDAMTTSRGWGLIGDMGSDADEQFELEHPEAQLQTEEALLGVFMPSLSATSRGCEEPATRSRGAGICFAGAGVSEGGVKTGGGDVANPLVGACDDSQTGGLDGSWGVLAMSTG